MWTAVGALLSIVLVVLRFYLKERRKGSDYEGDILEFDKALADRDTVALSRLFDELRAPKGSGGNSGRPDDKETSKRQL